MYEKSNKVSRSGFCIHFPTRDVITKIAEETFLFLFKRKTKNKNETILAQFDRTFLFTSCCGASWAADIEAGDPEAHCRILTCCQTPR